MVTNMISVIVPVYNVEKYLDDCVKSVVNQTFKEIEIILVDDGSSDASREICDSWKKRDSRITVYHKENGGLMSAWKYGVVRAKGVYIGFVDSDDWIDPNMYEKLFDVAYETNADVVCSGLIREFENAEKIAEKVYFQEGFYNKDRIRKEICPYLLSSKEYRTRCWSPNRVTKLFKKDILFSVLDDLNNDISIGEDLITTFAVLKRAESIYIMENFKPYHYRINDTSMIQKFSTDKYKKIYILCKEMLVINTKYSGYDFEQQIYNDYVDLYFRTLESHISSSDSSLVKGIKTVFNSDEVQNAISKCDISMLSKKFKLYYYLLRYHLTSILIVLRILKSKLNICMKSYK